MVEPFWPLPGVSHTPPIFHEFKASLGFKSIITMKK